MTTNNSRSGLAVDLTATNRWLGEGETVKETDTGKVKIGPGLWNDLDYETTGSGSNAAGLGDQIVLHSVDQDFASDADDYVTMSVVSLMGDTFALNADPHRVDVTRDCLVNILMAGYWNDTGHAGGNRYIEVVGGSSFHEESGAAAPDGGTIQGVSIGWRLSAGDQISVDAIQASGVTLTTSWHIEITCLAVLA